MSRDEGAQYFTQIGELSLPPTRHFCICYSMHKSVTGQDSNSCDHLTSVVITIQQSSSGLLMHEAGEKVSITDHDHRVAMLHALFNTMPSTSRHGKRSRIFTTFCLCFSYTMSRAKQQKLVKNNVQALSKRRF